MKWLRFRLLVASGLAAVLLVTGCAGKATPTPTPTPTPAPTPTPSIAATPAPAPSPTPRPATPTPSPTPVSAIPPDVKPVTLKMAFLSPPPGPARSRGLKWWMDEVEKRTEGKVKIEPYWAESLVKVREILPATQSGTVDVGEIIMVYYPTQVSLWTYSDAVAFHTGDPAKMVDIMWKLYDSIPEMAKQVEQYNQVPVFLQATETYHLISAKKAVRSLDDIKGMKVGVFGGWIPKWVAAAGAVPVSVLAGEVFDALQRGTIDGRISAYETAIRYGWVDVIKYTSLTDSGAVPGIMGTVNKKVWDSLHPAAQKIMLQVGREMGPKTAEFYKEEGEDYIKTFRAKGIELIPFPDTERAKWGNLPAVKALPEEWVKSQEDTGLPGRKVMDTYLKLEGLK